MRVHTAVGHFKASPTTLFSLLSKEENLPQWATLFCKGIRREGEHHIITTPGGELYFSIDADPKAGTIDMSAGPNPDQMWAGPHRVASDNMGGSLFVFTYIQAPGQPDEEFENGCKGLPIEFEVIRKIVDGEAA